MTGAIDILKSERGIFAILLIIAVTVLCALGVATYDNWHSYTLWIFGIFAGGKTLTTGIGLIATGKSDSTTSTTPTTPS